MPKYQLTDSAKARSTATSETQRSAGIENNVREAILATNANAYAGYFDIVQDMQTLPLHSSFGSKQAEKGVVISFSVAGSSYYQPLRPEKGAAGKYNLWVTDQEGNRAYKNLDKNKVYTFTDQHGNQTTLRGSEAVKAFAKRRTVAVFGEGGELGYKEIRKKQSPNKIKYAIAGTSPGDGKFNVGDYSIEKTADNICKLGERRLLELLMDESFVNSTKEITLSFTGHSRGGVAAMHGAMKLKALLRLPMFAPIKDRVHMHTVLYDPVPGPNTSVSSGVNQVVDLKRQTKEMEEAGLAPLDDKDHTTVVYSIGCNHPDAMFPPMKVLGADTVILTSNNHDSGLKDVETQFGVKKRSAYINTDNLQAYRASGLNEMPNGVYIADENKVMVRAKSMEQVETIMDRVFPSGANDSNRRLRRISEVSTIILEKEGGAPTLRSIARGFNTHDPFYVVSSPEFRDMRKAFEDLTDLLGAKRKDYEEILLSMRELKAKAMEYLQVKDDGTALSNRATARVNVAKNIVRFLDNIRADELFRMASPALDRGERTKDIRKKLLKNAKKSLEENANYLRLACRKLDNGGKIARDMFKESICSILADHFFLSHSDYFMPKPIVDARENPAPLRAMENLLGSDSKSLYVQFAKSKAVEEFVDQIFSRPEKRRVFMSAQATLAAVAELLGRVREEDAMRRVQPNPASKLPIIELQHDTQILD